jgi:hypothetical protein
MVESISRELGGKMNKSVISLAVSLFGVLSPFCSAQDKPKAEDGQKAEVRTTPVKVQVVFTEFEGDKKVKSLPYILYVNAPDVPELKPGWVKLRVGSRVPIYTGGNTGSMTYLDVGTNIDARSAHFSDGHLSLQMKIERSWVEGGASVPVAKSDGSVSEASRDHFQEPIIGQFVSELDLKLREAKSVESTMATDPLSGKVLKIDVSFTLVK